MVIWKLLGIIQVSLGADWSPFETSLIQGCTLRFFFLQFHFSNRSTTKEYCTRVSWGVKQIKKIGVRYICFERMVDRGFLASVYCGTLNVKFDLGMNPDAGRTPGSRSSELWGPLSYIMVGQCVACI